MRSIPLLLFLVLAYFLIAFVWQESLQMTIFSIGLPSGAEWGLNLSDLLLAVGLVLLYFEVLKSTETHAASVFDHALSLGLFVVCIIAFLVIPQAGTDTFFLITLMTLLDVVAGFTVTITGARRDFAVERTQYPPQ